MYPTFAFQTIVVAAIVFFQSSNSAATTYYLDADGGSDLNGGTSPSLAWASLDRASIGSYQPGDQILLQAGDTFNGKLYLEGVSGAQGNPVVVAAFGTGSKPVIDWPISTTRWAKTIVK